MKRAILLFLLWSVSGLAATTEVRQDRTTRVLVGRSTIVSSNFLGQTTQPLSQFAATTSDELAGVLSDETGSGGGFVRATSPTLTTPDLGTPSAANLANATNLPIATGVSGLGTGIATWLATPSSANLASALTDETGSGSVVLSASPTFTGTLLAAAITASGVVTGSGLAASSSSGTMGWSDVVMARATADTLALRRGVNLQNLRIYGTYTDDSTGEWVAIESGSTVFDIKTVANGTGTANSLRLGTGGAARWQIDTSGHYTAVTDNIYDIGANGANRPRNVYIANNIWAGASGSIGWASGSIAYSASSGVITLYNNGATDFGRLQFGGTSASFPAVKRSATELQVRLADDSADAPLKAAQLTTTGGRVVNRTADTSTSITLTSAHHFVTLNNASPVTCNLPAVASNSGREYWIKNLGAGSVTIDPNSTEQIRDTTSDASTLTLTAGGTCHIICDGTRWERF